MTTGRIFVIGDIHGCVDELDTLLANLRLETADKVCFLGDYIDRGPDARGVVERLLELEGGPADCVFLKGNHEDMLLAFLGREGKYGDSFLGNGGAVTLRSYGLPPRRGTDLAESLPASHLSFFERLQSYWQVGRCLCVHAGVRPGIALADQAKEDLFWIRKEFFSQQHDLGLTVLYGHTPRKEVDWAPPQRIGLDTGLVYGGSLSCLELRGATLLQVARRSKEVVAADVAKDLLGQRLA